MHKIGIISDTHNVLRENVKDILSSCSAILHAGDIAAPHILEELASIAPVYAVRGNADREWAAHLPSARSLELFGLKIYMTHHKKHIQEHAQGHDLVIYGHSHKYEESKKDGIIWLNPGGCGARRFTLPVTMALLTITDTSAEINNPKAPLPPPFHIERIQLAAAAKKLAAPQKDMKEIVLFVMKETDKGKPVAAIAKSCQISEELAAQICRLYVTHPGVSADGILGKMGL